MATKKEIIKLTKDVDAFSHESMSDTEIQEQLIWRWFLMLRKNGIFKKYCDVRRTGDKSNSVAALNASHPRLREIYDDWGDIYAIEDTSEDSAEWRQWLDKRRNLFGLYRVEDVTASDGNVPVASVSLNFPTGLSSKQFHDLFKDYLKEYSGLVGSGTPKYKLRTGTRKSQIRILDILDRVEVWRDIELDCENLPEGDPLKDKYKRIASLAINEQILRKVWGLNWQVESELYKVTIDRTIEFYQRCVDESILNTFPPTFGEAEPKKAKRK